MLGPSLSLMRASKACYFSWLGLDLLLSVALSFGVQLVVSFAPYFSGGVWHPKDLQVSQYVVSVESSYL